MSPATKIRILRIIEITCLWTRLRKEASEDFTNILDEK
jgi:hypothetical protein